MAVVTIESQVANPSDLLRLASEEIAGVLFTFLVNLNHNEHYLYQHGRFNRSYLHNTAMGHGRTVYPELSDGPLRKRVDDSLQMAWTWLVNHGFLVEDPRAGRDFYSIPEDKRSAGVRSVKDYNDAALFPKTLVPHAIENATFDQFLRGRYDEAIAAAFRELEIKVRETSKLDNSPHVGAALMREAFNGPLKDLAAVWAGEEEGFGHMFAGVFQAIRNPATHRRVVTTAQDAAAVIAFVGYLFRVVETRGPLVR